MKSPFKFLDSFTLEDKDYFFGRDQEVQQLYDMIYRTSLLLVYGYSGTGKTSLIKCGLEGRLEGPEWLPIFISRKDDINRSFRVELNKSLDDGPANDNIPELLQELYEEYFRPIFLFFDQFEELFILGSPSEQRQFIDDIKRILDAKLPCKIVLIIREEFLGRLYHFEQSVPSLRDHRLRVEAMTVPKVKEVMKRSFDRFNISLEAPEEERLDEIVNAVREGKADIQLPFLQVYLDRLYRKVYEKSYGNEDKTGELPPIHFSKGDIAAVGAIEDVMGTFLDEQLELNQQKILEDHPDFPEGGILKILNLFVTDDGTKRPIPYSKSSEQQFIFDTYVTELLPSLSAQALAECLRMLEESRVLKIGDETIELIHDSLAARVFDKRTVSQKRKSQILREIRTFREAGQLLNEKLLLTYSEELGKINLSSGEKQFIADSQKEVEKIKREKEEQSKRELELANQKVVSEQRAKKRQRIFTLLVAVLAIVAIQQFFQARSSLSFAQKANTKVIDSVLLQRFDENIRALEYGDAIKRIEEAVDFNVKERERALAGKYLEPAFFFVETSQLRKAIEQVRKAEKLIGKKVLPESIENESKLSRQVMLDAIEQLDPSGFATLQERYYPSMISVEGGGFEMGCDPEIDPACRQSSQPRHPANLNSFEIAKYETTWWQYYLYARAKRAFLKFPWWGAQGDHPVVYVNWYDALEYANWVSRQKGLQPVYTIDKGSEEEDPLKWKITTNWEANGFRLPTEAEWEYAAKAGSGQSGFRYSGSDDPGSVGWIKLPADESELRTQSVGQKVPNQLGLYDMIGNVEEWCWDWYASYPVSISLGQDHPKGPESGTTKVIRGGSWNDYAPEQSVTRRHRDGPDYLSWSRGFRLVRNQ
jgi:formylglycine-generating enzyme required for sulfatase activity